MERKLAEGSCKDIGDVDCWGYESKPTLAERRSAHMTDIDMVKSIQNTVDTMEEKGLSTLQAVPNTVGNNLLRQMKALVCCLGMKNKELRQQIVRLDHSEEKFRKLGGSDWMHSKFYPVICSIRVTRNEMKNQISESLRIVDDLSFYGASINGSQQAYSRSDTVVMSTQENYSKLNVNYDTNDSRYIPQRKDKWFQRRRDAVVTGSTCNAALGLGKLKEQQQHFDTFVLKKDKEHPDEETSHRMAYGTEHEIDAVATLTGKILPFLYPNVRYFEEGCDAISSENNPSFMVVSPDGSLRMKADEAPCLMYENKCKAPTSYTPTAYYSIPQYYVTQLLCEMHAYECKELLFTCWTPQSTTVFRVQDDAELWNSCWEELTRVYDCEKKTRPTRFSTTARALKNSVKGFVETNVSFVGEFPSCSAIEDTKKTDSQGDRYVKPVMKEKPSVAVNLSKVHDTLAHIGRWLETTYNLLRTVASEILVFMLNDLDRVYDMEINNAHPIAYALKGPSMSVDIMRNMMAAVLAKCSTSGLSVLATASDGQWHQYGVRSDDGRPLTVHQLQREH